MLLDKVIEKVIGLLVFWLYLTEAHAQINPDIVFPDDNVPSATQTNLTLVPSGHITAKVLVSHSCNANATTASGIFYLGCRDDRLYSVTSNGRVLWTHNTSRDIDSMAFIGVDGTIYHGSDNGSLYAFSSSGKMLWRRYLGGRVFTSPIQGPDGTIFVGSQSNLHALSRNGVVKWRMGIEGSASSSPSVASDGTVIIGSFSRYLYAITQEKKLKWKAKLDGIPIQTAVLVPEGDIYVATKHSLLKIRNGKVKWRLKLKGTMKDRPLFFANGYLMTWTSNENLVLISSNGVIFKTVDFGVKEEGYLVRLPSGRICIGIRNGLVLVVDSKGTPLWKLKLPWGVEARPAGLASEHLVLPTSRGIIWAAPPL